eukprot:CAMPEP_0170500962 /NCGR_PEP_ID=MMETSP0208-20121228/36702_1 /TAXON_ID=197538 /ORGANISM="Strombidium inclinatum, Strain S3" /LENGTH=49 /DNA_ID= /DNA_START= /DNA_END= /DNA_ORIENTATION=
MSSRSLKPSTQFDVRESTFKSTTKTPVNMKEVRSIQKLSGSSESGVIKQ